MCFLDVVSIHTIARYVKKLYVHFLKSMVLLTTASTFSSYICSNYYSVNQLINQVIRKALQNKYSICFAQINIKLLLLLHLIPTFIWGRCTMTYASMYRGRTLHQPTVPSLWYHPLLFPTIFSFFCPHPYQITKTIFSKMMSEILFVAHNEVHWETSHFGMSIHN